MLDHAFYVGAAVCIVCIVVSRIISERNYKKLSEEQKETVMDGMASMRTINLVPVVLVTGLFLGVMLLKPPSTLIPTLVVFGIMLGFLIVRHFWVSKKFEKLDVPKWYVRNAQLSSWIYYSGLLVIIASSLLPELGK